MNVLNYIIIVSFSLLLAMHVCTAQETAPDFPKIGQPVPEFVMRDIHHYHQKQLTSEELQGQYYILDFWAKYCASCIASFPKVNKLQQEFKDQLTIFLVGYEDPENEARPLYERVRQHHKLELAAAFDSVLMKRFVPGSIPHQVWVDKNGIVQAITGGSRDLTEEIINKFISGEKFEFQNATRDAVEERKQLFDRNKPFLIDGNGGGNDTDYLYRSVLTKWKPGMAFATSSPFYENLGFSEADSSLHQFTLLKTPLQTLYSYAYFGRSNLKDRENYGVYHKPLLEIRDTLLFKYDFKAGNGLYCYSLELPKRVVTRDKMMQCLRNELDNYFGYTAKVEEREMPCYVLTASSDAIEKLKTKGGVSDRTKFTNIGGTLTNEPLSYLLYFLRVSLNEPVEIYDETGITDHVDLEAKGLLTTIKGIQETLQGTGLSLVPATRKMKVLVISETI